MQEPRGWRHLRSEEIQRGFRSADAQSQTPGNPEARGAHVHLESSMDRGDLQSCEIKDSSVSPGETAARGNNPLRPKAETAHLGTSMGPASRASARRRVA